MARLRPEQISELQERAMALFLDGKIDESLEILKEEKLRSIGTGKK